MKRAAKFAWLAAALAGGILARPVSAPARITPADYRDVGVTLPANAALPPAAVVTGADGRQRPVGALVDKPTVFVFADYTCTTLCGPIVAFAAAALEGSGLRPNEFRLLIIGLNPKDGAADAAKMRRDNIDPASPLNAATEFVTADAATVQRLTAALGYRFAYDRDDDTYIHPAAAYVLTANGHVSRVLTGIGLSGTDMRLALVEASAGKLGGFRDSVRLICSHFDPAHGTYNVAVSRVLEIASLATVLVLAGGIGALLLMGRRREA